MDWEKTSARRDEKHLSFGIRFVVTYIRGFTVNCRRILYIRGMYQCPAFPPLPLTLAQSSQGLYTWIYHIEKAQYSFYRFWHLQIIVRGFHRYLR